MNQRGGIRGLLRKAGGIVPIRWARPTTTYSLAANSRAAPAMQRDLRSLVDRYHGYVYTAATLNAQAVASGRLRLYQRQPEVSGGKAFGAFGAESIGYKARAVDGRDEAFKHRAKTVGGHSALVKSIESGENVVEITDEDHPVLRLLTRAAPGMTQQDLFEAVQLFVELTGTGPIWKWKPDEYPYPVSLFPLAGHYTRPVIDKDHGLVAFRYGKDYGKEITLQTDEVVYLREFDPNNPYGGKGWLSAAVAAADLSFTIDTFKQTYLDRGASPSMVLNVKGQMPPDVRKRNESAIDSWYAGSTNAGKVMMLSGDVTAQDMNGGGELPMILSDDQCRDKISTISGVPKALLTSDDVNLANGMIAAPHWWMMTIAPKQRKLAGQLNESLLCDFGDDRLFVEFDPINVQDEDIRANRVRADWQAGVITLNEARAANGMDADRLDGEKRVFELQAESQPAPAPMFGGISFGEGSPNMLDEPIAPDDTNAPEMTDQQRLGLNGAQVAALQELLQSVSDGLQSSEVVRELIEAAFPFIDESKVDRMVTAAQTFQPTPRLEEEPPDVPQSDVSVRSSSKDQPREIKMSDMLDVQSCTCCNGGGERSTKDSDIIDDTSLVNPFEAHIQTWYARMTRDVSEAVAGGRGVSDAMVDSFARSLRELTADDFARVFNAGMSFGSNETGEAIDGIPSRAMRALENYQLRFSLEASRNAADRIGQQLEEATRLGETTEEQTDRIQQHLSNESRWASERIARTETARAHRNGRIEAWNESGIVEGKQWVLSRDPCELCRAIAKQFNRSDLSQPFAKRGTRIMGDEGTVFNLDWEDLDGPPAHPGCRCDIEPIMRK